MEPTSHTIRKALFWCKNFPIANPERPPKRGEDRTLNNIADLLWNAVAGSKGGATWQKKVGGFAKPLAET